MDSLQRDARVIVAMATFGSNMSAELNRLFEAPSIARNTSVATLLTLMIKGPSRPVDLAEEVGLTRGGMTNVIESLAEHRLVERFEDPNETDGRAVWIRLSSRGNQVAEGIVGVMAPAIRELLKRSIDLLVSTD